MVVAIQRQMIYCAGNFDVVRVSCVAILTMNFRQVFG
jgi:hypothetical protein